MSDSCPRDLLVSLTILSFLTLTMACGSTAEESSPPVAAEPAPQSSGSAESADADAATDATAHGTQEQPGPLPSRPLPPDHEFGKHVTPTEIVLPDGEARFGALQFEPFGPAPGTSDEVFAQWGALLKARFLEEPPADQLEVLDAKLAHVPIVDATPVFINALLGLDMGDPDDIRRAHAITSYWYEGMLKWKHVILDGNESKLSQAHVRNRMLVVDGWVRMWKRTLDSENGVSKLRTRIEDLIVDRERARREAQRAYEEKLRKREEEARAAEAEAAETDTETDAPGA